MVVSKYKKKQKGDTGTSIYICPKCRNRWQRPIYRMGCEYYAWRCGGDLEKICPICEKVDEIQSLNISLTESHPLITELKMMKKDFYDQTGRRY